MSALNQVGITPENEITGIRLGLLSRSKFESLQEAAFDLFQHFMLRIVAASTGLINFKVASELSAMMSSKLLEPVYSQINPDIVGSDYRDLRVALLYGQKLADISGNASPEAVLHLVEHYPSHDFIIDNEEAEQIFENVEEPSDSLYKLLELLGDAPYIEQDPSLVLSLTGRQGEAAEGGEDDGDEESSPPVAEGGGDDRSSTSEPPDEGGGAG
jgi:hypothetical protein